MKTNLYLGIDIGGSSIKFGWGNCKQGLLNFFRYELRDNTLESLNTQIELLLLTVDKNIGLANIKSIGLGTPGTIDLQTGLIIGVNPNLPQWTNLSPKILFSNNLDQEVFVDNDANLMTLAEAMQFPENSCIAGITIGSGIGCGFVQNRQIFHGAHGYAMELGHTIVKSNGIKCNCGRLGCLEAYSSVNGLINIIRTRYPNAQLTSMSDVLSLSNEDNNIKKILLDSVSYLSVSLANLVTILDVDAIVIGGGATDLEGYPHNLLFQTTYDLLPEQFRHKAVIKKAVFGNQAGVMGAIILAEGQYK